MPVNWSLLNPSLPATAQTINPFAALNAGRAQAEERVQNQQASELRGLQIQGAKAGLESQQTEGQAAALAAQAWQLRETDPAKAAELMQQGMKLNPAAFSATTKQFIQQDRDVAATASSRATALTADQKRTAPFMLQAVQMAKGGDVEGARAYLQSQGLYDPQHEQFLTNPQLLAPFEQTLLRLVPVNPRTELTAYQQELADAASRRADASVAAANRPLVTGSGRNTPAPTGPYSTDSANDRAAAARIFNDPNASESDKLAAAAILGTSATGGTVAERFTGRVIQGANLATAAIENVVNLPFSADTGWFGSGTPPDGLSILDASGQVLRNAMSSDNTQAYNTMMAGVMRNLAIIESAGLAPTGKFTDSMGAVLFRPEDSKTGFTRLRKMAEMRQIVEEGLQPLLAGRASKEQKEFIRHVIDRVRRAVPITHANLTAYQQALASKPELTYHQWAASVAPRRSTPRVFGTPAAPLNLGQGISIGAPAAPTPAARPAAPAGGTRPPLESFQK